MLRLVMLLTLSLMTLFAHDNYILQIQTAMIPKLMTLDQSLPLANPHAKITLAVIYDETSPQEAKMIAEAIAKQQNGRLGNAQLITTAWNIDNIPSFSDISYIYLLETSPKKVRLLATNANERRIPILAYDPDDLANGALLSIGVERRTIIYLSKSALKLSQHRFTEALYQIAKIVE